jgi:nucleoside-diphosphate-sugar epimerase
MKVLIIGGSGFIGSRLVETLQESGHIVRIFDKNPSRNWPDLVTLGDVRDLDALEHSLDDIELIYNLAAEHRDDVTPVSLYYDVNVGGAKNIVAAAAKKNVNKIIFTSTVAVYGLNQVNPDESFNVMPFNDYGHSKLKAEEVFRKWVSHHKNRSLTIIRPVVIYGEGNRGNVYNLIKQIQSRNFIMVGDGNNRKSMAYVGNIVNFLLQASSFEDGSFLYNFADKHDLTVNELVEFLQEAMDSKTKNLKLPYLLGLTGGYGFDLLSKITRKKYSVSSIRIKKFCSETTVSAKAIEGLGFKSPFTIKEGLGRMVENIDENIYFEGGG